MNPIQIQIGDLIAKSPDKEKSRKHLLRREKVQTAESQIAVARDGNIYIEPVTKDILNRMKNAKSTGGNHERSYCNHIWKGWSR